MRNIPLTHSLRRLTAGVLAFLVVTFAVCEQSGASDYLYKPAWDSVCGLGRKLSEGCEPVRARKIVDASKYPWSAIGRINFAGHRTYLHCTGALIGERVVLTAAHCLYNTITKKWLAPRNIHFLAGYQRGTQTAHARAVRYVVSEVYDTSSRMYRYNPKTDWALVELDKLIGTVTGYLGWAGLDGGRLANSLQSGGRIALAGYPAIRQHVLSVDENCKQATLNAAEDLMIHGCAGALGDSGGPVLLMENGNATILSINSGVAQLGDKVLWASVPFANFSDKIVDLLGDNLVLQDVDGYRRAPGKPPGR